MKRPKAPIEKRRLRVLHLEDDLHDRGLVLEALKAADFACEFRWVENRAEFENALGEPNYDLIISDFTLPSYDGAQALETARKALPRVPFIFVSGTIGEERAVESLKNGATDYVLKTRMERLIPAVKRALRESEELGRRREVEHALLRSEERFREMAENIQEVFWTSSPDGRQLLYVSPAFEQMWKRPAVDALSHPTSWLEAVVPEDQPLVDGALGHLNQGTSYRVQFRIRWPDGTVRWIESTGYPIQNLLLARVERVVGVAIDVTEAKIAGQKLEAERNLLRTIMDNLPDHIFARDRDSRHLLNNRASLAALKASTEEETIGKTDFDFYPPEMARFYQADDQEVFRTGKPMFNREELGLNPAGGKRWQLTTKVPLRDATGNVVGLVGIGRDITELKEAAGKIKEQARMLDQAHEAILRTDLDGRIQYWNSGAERLLGWNSAEAVGRKIEELIGPADTAATLVAREQTLATGQWHGELKIHNKAGDPVVLETHRTLLRDHAGQPNGHLSISNDVTERRKLEAQALRAQRMESIGTLASGIAHDLNNILAPILMSIALLKIKTPDNENIHKMLDQLAGNVNRGAALVQQVLAFGRGAENERLPVQAKHIAREIEQIIIDTFPKNIEFELTLAPDPWTVVGDPTQIHQVLLNLCVNARDAMPGGGKLVLHLENATLEQADLKRNPECGAGPYLVISVTDSGTGIPPAIREKIFDPFFTTKEIGKGTGLGLSTTLAIAKSHGGFISLDSTVGQGTTFRIHLPANPGISQSEPLSAEPANLPKGNNELVLVVDDELPIRELAKFMLERFGYRVLLASNGTQAVALYALHREEIAVVITDMTMPIMDGPATILALQSINPQVKVIGSSGQGRESSGNAAKVAEGGIEYFLPKPYTTEVMLRTLRRSLTTGRAVGARPTGLA